MVKLLGGEMDFNVSGFVVDFEVEFTFALANENGLGVCRGAERTYGFKQIFPSNVDT